MRAFNATAVLLSMGVMQAVLVAPVSAQAVPLGISLSPSIQSFVVQKNESIIQYKSYVTNHTQLPVRVNITTQDFTTRNQSGSLLFYGPHYNAALDPHALAAQLVPQQPTLTIAPGQTAVIPVSIDGLEQLAPGGHYGAVLYHIGVLNGAPRTTTISSNQVLTSLIFLSGAGTGTQSLSLTPPPHRSWYFKTPSSLPLTLTDSGDTQTIPRGYINVTTTGGEVVSHALVNPRSGLLLPGSSRLFEPQLASQHYSLFGGHYKLSIAYRPDNSASFRYYSSSFYVVGPGVILAAAVLIGLLVVSVFGWRYLRVRKIVKARV